MVKTLHDYVSDSFYADDTGLPVPNLPNIGFLKQNIGFYRFTKCQNIGFYRLFLVIMQC